MNAGRPKRTNDDAHTTKKAPNPIDRHVGSRVRMRRMLVGMSQEKLGEALGLTFQQVQKYEKGTNRIGIARLLQIAKALKTSVDSFFEGAPGSLPVGACPQTKGETARPFGLLDTTEGAALAEAFVRIDDPAARRIVLDLAVHLAKPNRVKEPC